MKLRRLFLNWEKTVSCLTKVCSGELGILPVTVI